MDVFYAFSYGSAGWLALQAVPLIVSPTIVTTLLSPEIREPTALEFYLARSLGIALVTLGTLVVLLTGSVPLTSSLSDTTSARATTEASDPKAPYAVPTLTITTLYHSACAFYCYARYITGGQVTLILATISSASLASVGLWCMLFATSHGRISRKTGADKRTSGYPFKNSESASAKKRQMSKAL
ncbi:hypothetical protein OIDMADRAFT_18706 [Oidiodendron maius Zn]|uniref:Uncharacterized protein n=1 Tax=Oidiodendron maius (strain Zn) TaxID=913774 RepID=A0A0C3HFE3_OIDMZ|nr:hypothetical protein OIDMADRAFT_18706 [Oidiodendron maius Zn]